MDPGSERDDARLRVEPGIDRTVFGTDLTTIRADEVEGRNAAGTSCGGEEQRGWREFARPVQPVDLAANHLQGPIETF
jgi:hypothetical protein